MRDSYISFNKSKFESGVHKHHNSTFTPWCLSLKHYRKRFRLYIKNNNPKHIICTHVSTSKHVYGVNIFMIVSTFKATDRALVNEGVYACKMW